MWTNQIMQIGIPHLHRNGPIRDQNRNFLYKSIFPKIPLFVGEGGEGSKHTFQFSQDAMFPGFANCSPEESLLLLTLDWRLLLALDWWLGTFC